MDKMIRSDIPWTMIQRALEEFDKRAKTAVVSSPRDHVEGLIRAALKDCDIWQELVWQSGGRPGRRYLITTPVEEL